jgi:hypothetical protein
LKSVSRELNSLALSAAHQATLASLGDQAAAIQAQSERQWQDLKDQQENALSGLVSKIDESSLAEEVRAERTAEHINQLSAQLTRISQEVQENLDQAARKFNTALRKLDANLSESKTQMLTWLNDESDARNQFQENVFNRLDKSDQVLFLTYKNTSQQLLQQKQFLKLQIMILQSQGVVVPQLTAGSDVQSLPFEMSSQPQRLLLRIDDQQSFHPRNNFEVMQNFNRSCLVRSQRSLGQTLPDKQVVRALKAATGSTGRSIKMEGWQDFANDTDQRERAKGHGQQLVSNAILTKNIPKDVQYIAACTIQKAMKINTQRK